MATPVNGNDPRVKRTRQLLLQAFAALVEERHNVYSISVQAIANRATVNRATFYAHFDNKYALAAAWGRVKFQRCARHQLPPASPLQPETLRVLILNVFEFLVSYRCYLKPKDEQFDLLFEIAMQQELQEIFVTWLNQVPSRESLSQERRAATASVISWAIFGPAAQWSRGDLLCPAEAMAEHVLTIVVAARSPIITMQ